MNWIANVMAGFWVPAMYVVFETVTAYNFKRLIILKRQHTNSRPITLCRISTMHDSPTSVMN